MLALLLASGLASGYFRASAVQAQSQSAATGVRPIGTIKAVQGNTVILTTDSGPELQVQVQESTRLLRIEPGQKDLKGATPVQLQDLQVGDRILARGAASGNTVNATAVILMKRAAIQQKQQEDQLDWERRGVAGLVKAVDQAAGTITISARSAGAVKPMTVHVAKETIIRRYAPDSVRFNDAKPGTLAEIKPGDEMRARGKRSADGGQLSAEEVVSGSFRNIAGIISFVDQSANEISVVDPATKKAVKVKITAESQVRKLPPTMAQMIAMRLKGTPGGGPEARSGSPEASHRAPDGHEHAAAQLAERGSDANSTGQGPHNGAPPDFQQLLNRLPPAKLSDLQKGDAVMMVSTEGRGSGAVTAITLLAGVEPILTAAPSGSGTMLLSAWSLGGAAPADSAGATETR
jgi:hypothetical protein